MKLEVGMYAYSKHSRDYGIGKIVNIHTNGFANQEVEIQYKDVKLSTSYDDVIASHELIDLIEVGDYVNGFYVIDFDTLENGENAVIVNADITYGYGMGVIPEKEIYSIATNENFSKIEYEIDD